jgi:hypothetical protein
LMSHQVTKFVRNFIIILNVNYSNKNITKIKCSDTNKNLFSK